MFPTVCHHSSFALLWNSQMCVCTQLSVTSCWWVPVCLCSEGGPGPQAGGAGVRSEHERRRSASQRQLRPHPPEQAGRLLPQGVSADRYRQTHARKLLERDRNVLILVYTSRGRFLHHLFPNTLLLSAVIPSHLLSLFLQFPSWLCLVWLFSFPCKWIRGLDDLCCLLTDIFVMSSLEECTHSIASLLVLHHVVV